MKSIRNKFYLAYISIIAMGAIALREYAEAFRSLPKFHGIDIYALLLGMVYLVISVVLLEFFVFARIQHIRKELKKLKSNEFCSTKRILDLSKDDELGKIVFYMNEALSQLGKKSEKLHHKNTLYLSLVEDPSIYVYRFKEDGTLTFINKSYADMIGKKYKDVLNGNVFDFIQDPEKLKQKMTCLNPSIHSVPVSIDMPKIINQSAPKWIAWNVSAVFNQNNTAVEYQVVGINMHQTRRTEKISDVEYDNIFLLNLEGKISYISSIIEYENIVGEKFADCLHEEDQSLFLRTLCAVKEKRQAEVCNVRLVKQGNYIVSQILVEASVDKENHVSSVSVKMIDITGIEGAQAEVMGAVNNMNRLLKESYVYPQ